MNKSWRENETKYKYLSKMTRCTVKNGISNLYILLKSALKMQEMPFQRPKSQFPDPPRIVSSLWPPPP